MSVILPHAPAPGRGTTLGQPAVYDHVSIVDKVIAMVALGVVSITSGSKGSSFCRRTTYLLYLDCRTLLAKYAAGLLAAECSGSYGLSLILGRLIDTANDGMCWLTLYVLAHTVIRGVLVVVL